MLISNFCNLSVWTPRSQVLSKLRLPNSVESCLIIVRLLSRYFTLGTTFYALVKQIRNIIFQQKLIFFRNDRSCSTYFCRESVSISVCTLIHFNNEMQTEEIKAWMLINESTTCAWSSKNTYSSILPSAHRFTWLSAHMYVISIFMRYKFTFRQYFGTESPALNSFPILWEISLPSCVICKFFLVFYCLGSHQISNHFLQNKSILRHDPSWSLFFLCLCCCC